MARVQLKESLTRFRQFVLDLKPQPINEADWNGPLYLFTQGNKTAILFGNDALQYQGLVEEIYECVAARQTLSLGAVENLANATYVRIRELVEGAGESNSAAAAEEEIQKLNHELLEPSKNWSVVYAVGGIDREGLPMEVGRVSFQVRDARGR